MKEGKSNHIMFILKIIISSVFSNFGMKISVSNSTGKSTIMSVTSGSWLFTGIPFMSWMRNSARAWSKKNEKKAGKRAVSMEWLRMMFFAMTNQASMTFRHPALVSTDQMMGR